jgi:hypothetical protein
MYNIDDVLRCFIITTRCIAKDDLFYADYGQDYAEIAKTFVYCKTLHDLSKWTEKWE